MKENKEIKIECVVPENIHTPTRIAFFLHHSTPLEFTFQGVVNEPPTPQELLVFFNNTFSTVE